MAKQSILLSMVEVQPLIPDVEYNIFLTTYRVCNGKLQVERCEPLSRITFGSPKAAQEQVPYYEKRLGIRKDKTQ